MDFKTIINTIFFNKSNWQHVSDKDKIDNFFIVNRYMSKKYPLLAQKLNKKNIDKATAMDIWFMFFKNTYKVPDWFWKGKTKKIEPNIKDWKIVAEYYQLNLNDMHLLCELYPSDVKDEIKRINILNKEITK